MKKFIICIFLIGLAVSACDTKKQPKPEPAVPTLIPLNLVEITGTWKLQTAALLSPVNISNIYDENNALLYNNPSAREGFCSKNSLLTINNDNTCTEEFVTATYNFPNATTQDCPAVIFTGSFVLNTAERTITMSFNNSSNNKTYFIKSVENGIMIAESESIQGGVLSKRSITYQKQ